LPAQLYILSPAVDLVAIIVVLFSALNISRQSITSYFQVRTLFIAVHVIFSIIVIFEFLRNFITSYNFLYVYTIVNTTLVLTDVSLLTLITHAIYKPPEGDKVIDIAKSITKQRRLFFLPFFLLYLGFAEVYLIFGQPFQPVTLNDIFNITRFSTVFDVEYLYVLLIVLLVFSIYPTGLLLVSRRHTKDRYVRRVLMILSVTWIGIGLILLVFNGFLIVEQIDATSVGYLLAAILFAVTAAQFKKSTVLSSFFEVRSPIKEKEVIPFAKKIERPAPSSSIYLFEIVPAFGSHDRLLEFVSKVVSEGYVPFVFTQRGSAVYQSLSRIENVRFFL